MDFLEEKGRVIVEGVMEPLQPIMEEGAMELLHLKTIMELLHLMTTMEPLQLMTIMEPLQLMTMPLHLTVMTPQIF